MPADKRLERQMKNMLEKRM